VLNIEQYRKIILGMKLLESVELLTFHMKNLFSGHKNTLEMPTEQDLLWVCVFSLLLKSAELQGC